MIEAALVALVAVVGLGAIVIGVAIMHLAQVIEKDREPQPFRARLYDAEL